MIHQQDHHDGAETTSQRPLSGKTPSPHDDHERHHAPLGLEIRSLSNMISRYLNATMPESARTATGGNVRIIMFLARNQDRDIFQYDIEERCSITPSTASRVLSLMEKKGLIERQAVERDARLRRIVLTPSAFDIVDELKRNANAMETTLFEGFSPSEMTRLSSYFIRMRSNLLDTGLVSGSCTNQRNAENGRSTS
ncbi:MarR family winged helix-turn-helix transcriptional regulator [Bifidobacterium crudilactis]|uniref:MarR family winged helix-turn-helix transcriptional regulator n=1 Tax=Bifidobacterium crudilactis TaxID=327277 RepID=UPI0012EC42E9|nr:MarR family transcriptional regulator [Bifidobacterium crudilactis]MCI2148961.1 MarR family transcriptional regulator [Bifidobacterium crudilactis]MCI2157401.1 MarR family transcriptional regulator [Bifidobacterium crudilactis]